MNKRQNVIIAAVVVFLAAAGGGVYLYKARHHNAGGPAAGAAAVQPAGSPSPSPSHNTPEKNLSGSQFGAHLAPPGVFYMVERVSETTDSGVYALDPGQKVLLLERKPNSLRITDGAADFEVKQSQVTDDLEVAELAGRKDPASRQALAAWRAARH